MCKTKPGSSEFSVFIHCATQQRQNSRSVSFSRKHLQQRFFFELKKLFQLKQNLKKEREGLS